MRALVMGIGSGLALAACSPGAFQCQSDAQCVVAGVQGQCLGEGACAFPDADCASGLRYGEHAGADAGTCVATSATSGGSGTGDTSASPSTSVDTSAGSTGSASTTLAADGSTSAPPDDSTGSLDDGATATTGEPLDPDLVVWYRFLPADPFADSGPQQLNATCVAGACPVVGADRGIELDGVDDLLLVDAAAPLDVAAPLTVTVWAYVAANVEPTFHSIVGRPVGAANYNSWEIAHDTSGRWFFAGGDGVQSDVVALPDAPLADWTFLALTIEGDVLEGWVDGVSVGQTTIAPLTYDTHPLVIGGDVDDGVLANWWHGRIDDVRVYARRLEPDELAAIMREAPPG